MRRMKLTQLACESLIIIVILMIFLTRISGDLYLVLPFLVMNFFLLRMGKVKVSRRVFLGGILLYSSSVIGVLLTGYSPNFAIFNFLILIFSIFFIKNLNFSYSDSNTIDVVYCFMFIVLLLGTFRGEKIADSIILFGTGDKNYSAIYVFLFFLYCQKKNKIVGICFSIIYAFIYINSRAFWLLIFLHYLTFLFRKNIYKVFSKCSFPFFKIMLILFVSVMIFSAFWVNCVPVDETIEYHQSLNDTSNRIRFVSNIRSFIFLFENMTKSLFNGYGYEYVSELGVDVEYSKLPTFMGTTVLQAHNSYLNLMVKIGIVPFFVYLALLGYILDEINSEDNIYYILPFLVNAMFMHSLLNGVWLILFVMIVSLPQKQGHTWKLASNNGFSGVKYGRFR